MKSCRINDQTNNLATAKQLGKGMLSPAKSGIFPAWYKFHLSHIILKVYRELNKLRGDVIIGQHDGHIDNFRVQGSLQRKSSWVGSDRTNFHPTLLSRLFIGN